MNRLRDLKAKSKIIILMTDGQNNAGKVPPLTAAEAAGVVHILVAREAAEHRLAELGDQTVAPVLPGARIGEHLRRQRRENERVIELA